MSELTLMLFRLAFLAVLWLFVIMAVGAIRTDMFTQRRPKARGGDKRAERPAGGRSRRESRKEPQNLVVVDGPLKGYTLPLSARPIVVGRASDATLVINDDYASGHHARFYSDDGKWYVEDLGSTNGTYIGNQRLNRAVPLAIGQPIRIGKTVLELRK